MAWTRFAAYRLPSDELAAVGHVRLFLSGLNVNGFLFWLTLFCKAHAKVARTKCQHYAKYQVPKQ